MKTKKFKIFIAIFIAIFLVNVKNVHAQNVDFRITGYYAVSGSSCGFTIQIRSSTTGISAGNSSIDLNVSNTTNVTGVNSISYLGNYTGYTNTSTPTFVGGVVGITTTAPSTQTTVSTSWEDYCYVDLFQNGTNLDSTYFSFGTIDISSWGASVGTVFNFQLVPLLLVEDTLKREDNKLNIKTNSIKILGNPVIGNNIRLQVSTKIPYKIDIAIVNVTGTLFYTNKFSVKEGENIFDIENDLPTGIYFLKTNNILNPIIKLIKI